MTKTEYLNQLEHYLRRLPQADYEEAMDYFREYFEEAGPENEAQVIQDLGNPKEAAYEILSQLLDKKVEEEDIISARPKHIILIVVLAILAAPIALPLTIAALALAFSIIILALSSMIITVSIGLTAFISTFVLIWEAIFKLSGSFSTFSLGLGASMFSLGLALIFAVLTLLLAQWFKLAFVKLSQWIIKHGYKRGNRV
ncbi:DUF1700 domain-containing protein [Streptococcus ratti]|uniref:DUF1700 domain-containing protein n=1 Tax=Streptococcus ratti TaxID=1341 RepID=A0A7X9LBV2_STRRT|nr:DUF1700 domain-containing protein [Streptococcus ratti]NMD48276.1 DUF1700 domain-containing protein [Streptococcus ratti]